MKLPKALNEATAGAALKYHIKRALERSHTISEFSKNLELSAKNAKFSNNTLKIIEELNNGVKQASEEIKENFKTSNLVKSIREQDTRPFEVIEDKEAFFKDLNQNLKDNATPLPKGMSVEEFKQSLESVENKDRFLEHLKTRENNREERLASLNLFEPILREPHIEIFIKDKDGAIAKKEYVKAFKDENKTRLYMLITQDNDTILRTFITDTPERYVRNHVRNADIIHSFIQPNRTAKSDNALSDVVVYGENTTQKDLTSQEDLLKNTELHNEIATNQAPLSPLEQANAEKLAKLESEKLESEQEFLKAKEQETKRKEALKKKLEHERGNAGNIESQTKIEVGEDIPTQAQEQLPKSRVRLNEREIYDLDYAIVKAKDLKPSFTTGGTQKRTDMNEEQIKSISQNFDPKKIFGSGGFEDLPIILNDGQVIAGNHRIQGMLNFTPKSRYTYEKAIKEYYHIDLKPDELLVRLPSKRLNNTEINNLAASSNQGRFNSESDHAIAVLSHYEAKLKELDQKLDADSIYSLKNIVAKNLNFDKATHPNVGDSNLALLMFNMPRTKTQGIELLNRWQKEFSNDIKSYEKVKKMFVDNAGSFHNLIHDMNFPNVSLNAYLSDIMDRSFANLKNYQTTSESLKDLSEKFYKTSSLEMFEKSDQSTSDISEILGSAIARFARFDDPSKALFEALKSDNIKKGLKDFKIADVTKDMFNPDSKEFKDIDIYDFTHYLLMTNREPNENNPTLKRLIEAVKDMQKESEKGIKETSKKSAEESKKGIKRDYSDTSLNNDEIKALLNNAKIPTSGRDAVIFGKNNLTPEIVEFLHKNNKRMIIEKASNKEVELLQNANFRHPEDVRASLDHEAIAHILKRHGVNSVNVRNGESPITYEDIANYRDVVNNADEIIRSIGKGNKENITAFKQVSGYAVVVEQAVNRNSELVLKTMFKSNGDYKNNNAYKKFSSTGLNANAKVQP
ncbi:PBECR3 domain-containing polyvalent protein [Helicobacter pylori]|uniref:PBECR3 domain-containing polyvalent protein n=1 Tax=Helicobacter pylori TaxID=210 RepID=UPI0036F43769